MVWEVVGHNATDWDVGQPIATAPEWVAQHMEPGEIAFKPICRVNKTAGRRTLALILAAPELRATVVRLLEILHERPVRIASMPYGGHLAVREAYKLVDAIEAATIQTEGG
jgi:hypothetical protein